MNRVVLAAMALAVALWGAACDAGDPVAGDGSPAVRGEAGAMGNMGAAGAGGGGGMSYVPDPAPRCDSAPTPTYQICDFGGGAPLPNGSNAIVPMFNAAGTQCYFCIGVSVPDAGCSVHVPAAVSGGQVIHPEHDIFCAPNTCDPTLCHPRS